MGKDDSASPPERKDESDLDVEPLPLVRQNWTKEERAIEEVFAFLDLKHFYCIQKYCKNRVTVKLRGFRPTHIKQWRKSSGTAVFDKVSNKIRKFAVLSNNTYLY